MKLHKIIIYIFLILLIILLTMGLFNFIVDPFCVFQNSNKINILENIGNNQYIPIKLKQKYKYDYVIVGDSSFKILYLDSINDKIANICYPSAKIKDIEKLLFTYLDMHPETKTVLLPLSFLATGSTKTAKITEYTGKNLTFEELYKLFLKPETTKKSIKKLGFNKSNNEYSSIYLKKIPLRKPQKTILKQEDMRHI